MTAAIHFVPWVRAGAAAAVTGVDPLAGSLAADATLRPWLRVTGSQPASQDARVRGPGHVTALAPHVVTRCEPAPGTAGFDPYRFVHIDLAVPDLPWRHTPAAAAARARLRPWLVLVVVRDQDGVSVSHEPGAGLPVLRIAPPAAASRELPDLADADAWAHVQSDVPRAQLAQALADDPGAGIARLVCPRRLEVGAAWAACLVPAFDVGCRAALGEDGAAAGEAAPAWDHGDPDALDAVGVRLPVLYNWTFTTGPDGDFESLARRLEPDEGTALLGRVPLDVTLPGPPLPRPDPPPHARQFASFVGPLRSRGARPIGPPGDYREWFEGALETALGEGRVEVDVVPARGYVPARDDPVVGPPLYGGLQAGRPDLPADADPDQWMRPLNLEPGLRAAAGLGAEVVRRDQESLMASAWAQVGAARETVRALDAAALAAETGRALARGLATLDDGALLQITTPLNPWVRLPGSQASLARDLFQSGVPRALLGAATLRATRPAQPLARLWRRHPPPGDVDEPAVAATAAFVAGVRVAGGGPASGWIRDATLIRPASAAAALAKSRPLSLAARPNVAAGLRTAAARAGLAIRPDGTLRSLVALDRELSQRLATPRRAALISASHDISGAPAAVRSQLDPAGPLRNALLSWIPGLAPLVGDGPLPRRLGLRLSFTDPLAPALAELDPRFLLPAAEQLAADRVALVDIDADAIAAAAAGANHELARELLWREFPAVLGQTPLRRFWDTGPDGADDIKPISVWRGPRPGANVTGAAAGDLAVVVIRGELVRRYPLAHVYAVPGVASDGTVVPGDGSPLEPVLQGGIDTSTRYYGLPRSATDLRGDDTPDDPGWFIAIEQPAHGPSFGLDAPADDGSDLTAGATAWADLTWAHLVPKGGSLDDVSHAVARVALPRRTPATIGGVTWGHNAAHMAAITWRAPFRLLIHASRLLHG